MIDIQTILGEYIVMSDGSPDMAWIVSAVIFIMFCWFVGMAIMNLIRAILK